MLLLCVISFLVRLTVCQYVWNENLANLLDMHNKYREDALNCKIPGQPAAKQMPTLLWDYDLARQAQQLSDTCRFQFGSPKSDKFVKVGQNIAGYPSVKDAMESWFSEHQYYNFDKHSGVQNSGNYLQIVSAKTTEIGCGVTKCKGINGFKYDLFVVCNYGEGADFTKRPYEKDPYKKCQEQLVPSVKPTHGKWHATYGTTEFNRKHCYCYK
ncbi:unnamed protein product [Trichobilharzia szidati]|nr:unnamed protein product [Trichobilharzia szidati]